MKLFKKILQLFHSMESDSVDNLQSALARFDQLLQCNMGDIFDAHRKTGDHLHITGNSACITAMLVRGNTGYILQGNLDAEIVRDLLRAFYNREKGLMHKHQWGRVKL